MSYLVSFCSCVVFFFFFFFFSPFSIAITSLGEERANLSHFRTFVRFVLVVDLSVSSSSWCLRRAAVCDCGTPWTVLLSFVSYVGFVLSLFISHLSFCWCQGTTVPRVSVAFSGYNHLYHNTANRYLVHVPINKKADINNFFFFFFSFSF